jgi:hypothetical protein
MAIKDIINSVISKLDGDNADALKQELRQALIEVDTLQEAKTQADGESKSRKEKIRALESELASSKDTAEKMTELEKEVSRLRTIETDYQSHKQTIFETRLNDWKAKQAKLTVPETDKNHARFKDLLADFKVYEEGKELTESDIAGNLDKFQVLEKAGLFSSSGDDKTITPPRPSERREGDRPQTSGQALFTNKLK